MGPYISLNDSTRVQGSTSDFIGSLALISTLGHIPEITEGPLIAVCSP